MAQEEDKKKKKQAPYQTLPNKQIMPMVGFGTYKLQDEKLLTDLLRKGLEMGYCKHIDTARYYNNQIPLGSAIKTVIKEGRCKREDLFVATKTFNHVNLDPILDLKEVLRLMQLDYVDMYYLHWPITDMDPEGKEWMHRPLWEFWEMMETCVKKGYTKHLGISNFNGQMINDLLCYAKIKPVALQIQTHPYLMQQSLVQTAQKNGIAVLAHTPLGRGDSYNNPKNDYNIIKDELINEIANKHGKTPGQVILKSSLFRGVGVIPKTSSLARLQQNWESWTVELTEDDMKKIRNIPKKLRICDGKGLSRFLNAFDN